MTGADIMQKYREVVISAAVACVGVWLLTRGGIFWLCVGLVFVFGGVIWGVSAFRRVRFERETAAPGLVEVDEGRIGYFGVETGMGGHVALDDLAEIRLITMASGLWWRLKTTDGQALLIPVQARGAETLYDAFAALPGIDMGRIGTALDAIDTEHILWRRRTSIVHPLPMRGT